MDNTFLACHDRLRPYVAPYVAPLVRHTSVVAETKVVKPFLRVLNAAEDSIAYYLPETTSELEHARIDTANTPDGASGSADSGIGIPRRSARLVCAVSTVLKRQGARLPTVRPVGACRPRGDDHLPDRIDAYILLQRLDRADVATLQERDVVAPRLVRRLGGVPHLHGHLRFCIAMRLHVAAMPAAPFHQSRTLTPASRIAGDRVGSVAYRRLRIQRAQANTEADREHLLATLPRSGRD